MGWSWGRPTGAESPGHSSSGWTIRVTCGKSGPCRGRPGAAFATGTGRHSGLETTLRQLIHWMMACGMLIVGLPWTERMAVSGSYYGATAAGGATADDLLQVQRPGPPIGILHRPAVPSLTAFNRCRDRATSPGSPATADGRRTGGESRLPAAWPPASAHVWTREHRRTSAA